MGYVYLDGLPVDSDARVWLATALFNWLTSQNNLKRRR
jgi:hypothetical protein